MTNNNNNIKICERCSKGIISPLQNRQGLILFVCSNCDHEFKHFEAMESGIVEPSSIKKLQEIYNGNIFGYKDLKPFIIDVVSVHYSNRAMPNTRPNHLLLVGPAGSSKTYFFELMGQVFNSREYEFLNSATSSGTGIASFLQDSNKINTLRFLVLDEIDKMPRDQQFKLLTALETGIIKEVKFKRYVELDVSNILFLATANHKDKIYEPLLTRFMVIEIPHYTYTDYRKITDGWIKKQYPQSANLLIDTIFPPNKEISIDDPSERLHIRTLKKLVNLSLGNPDKLASYLSTIDRYSSPLGDNDDDD
jgi:hypothetical protein